ncbi:MAG TPA: S9 family peptidase [Gemmatimonadales bacterium]|nr:S9 family peptidase [Gemmatimonadales bacterium]
MTPVLLFVLLILPSGLGAQQVPTPGPQDIPVAVPGDIGLAGDSLPDIARFLNVRSVREFAPSPDGQHVAIVTNTTGQPQLWVAPMSGLAPRQLTYAESGVTFHSWSPAGNWIIYGTDRGGNEQEGFYLISPDGRSERELLAPSKAFRVFGAWSPDGRRIAFASTERNGVDFDIYLMNVSDDGRRSEPVLVLQGKGGLYPVRWRPDGNAVVLSETRGEADNNVYLLDVRTKEVDTLFRPTDASAYGGFAWTPDSRGFYVVTNQERDLAGLARLTVGERLTWIRTPPVEVEGVGLSRDGRYLSWTENHNGYSVLSLRDLRLNRMVVLQPSLPRGVYQFTWADSVPVLVVHVSGPQVPGDVWRVDARSGHTSRVTHSESAGLDPARFVIPEEVSFRSWDGETIYGLLYRPTGAQPGAKLPVVVGVHGGPTFQARPTFNAAFQYLLTRGIAIFDLNFRGSTGYGKRFTRLDNQRLRPNAVKDMAAALDWLGSTGKIDTSRAAVMGGSYGGYMTFAAMTQLPGRFKAGVGFVGVSNWITALEGASPALKASDRIEYGNIDDPSDREFFRKLSPLSAVENVRDPLMVLHGANDPRDPVQEADQLVAAIRRRGGEVEYLRFPDEGHGIRKLSNLIIAYRRIARFLERTLHPSMSS